MSHDAEHDGWEPVRPRSREDFVDMVEVARGRHPASFDLPTDRPPSPAQVEQVEQELGCRLPADYVWFCERYGGGDFALARVRSLDPASDLYIGRRQSSPADGSSSPTTAPALSSASPSWPAAARTG